MFTAWNLPPPWPDNGVDSPGEAAVWEVTSPPAKMLQVARLLTEGSSWYHGQPRLPCPCAPRQSCSPLVPLIQDWRMRCPWGRKDALPPSTLPLRPLGWVLLQLAWMDMVSQAFETLGLASPGAGLVGHCTPSLSHRTAPFPELKRAWGRLLGVGELLVGKPTSQQAHRAGETQPRKGTRTGQAWMRPPTYSVPSLCYASYFLTRFVLLVEEEQ